LLLGFLLLGGAGSWALFSTPPSQSQAEPETKEYGTSKEETKEEKKAKKEEELPVPKCPAEKHLCYQLEPGLDWPTYHNSRYKFSIQYPSKWKIKEKKDHGFFLSLSNPKTYQYYQDYLRKHPEAPSTPTPYDIFIQVLDNSQNLSLEKFIDDYKQADSSLYSPCWFKEWTCVDNRKALKIYDNANMVPLNEVYLAYHSKIYILSEITQAENKTMSRKFKQIVTSFDFE